MVWLEPYLQCVDASIEWQFGVHEYNTTWFKIGQRKIAHKANPNPDTIGVTLVPSPDCNPRFMFLLTSDRLACNLKSDRIARCDHFSNKKRTSYSVIETTHYHTVSLCNLQKFIIFKVSYYLLQTIQHDIYILTLYWRYQQKTTGNAKWTAVTHQSTLSYTLI